MLALIYHTVAELRRDRKAVTALEYGLIASLIAVAIVSTLMTLGPKLATTFGNISAQLH